MILDPEIGLILFLTFKNQITRSARDMVCPYGNLATHSTPSGRQYKILCRGYYAKAVLNLFRTHTTSMDECLELCDKHHPLCSRISFIADMGGSGWLNCELKTLSIEKPSWYTCTMDHSAEVIAIRLPDLKCDNNTILQASDGGSFRFSCMDYHDLTGTTIRPLQTSHELTLHDCNQRCADVNFTCTAMVFDASLSSGYENCYLFDDLPPPLNRSSDYTFAYLEALSAKYVAPPPELLYAKDQSWIAGVIIGVIAVVLGLAWAWIRRARKKKKVV